MGSNQYILRDFGCVGEGSGLFSSVAVAKEQRAVRVEVGLKQGRSQPCSLLSDDSNDFLRFSLQIDAHT